MGSKCKILALMLVFLFMASLVILPSAKSQSSLSQVTILPDGTVNGTSHIHRSGNTYTLTANLNASIAVERDNIVLNGAGFILQGSENLTQNEIAVSLTNRTNDVVENLNITGYNVAISLYNSSQCTVSGNKIYGNNSNGISLTNSSNDWVKQNSVEKTQNTAVSLNNANDTIVSENSIGAGIRVENPANSENYDINSDDIIYGNEINGGVYIQSSNNTIIGNNISSGGIYLVKGGPVNNNFFTENNITNCTPAVTVLGYNNTFFKNNFIDDYVGVLCYMIVPDDVFYLNNFVNITVVDSQTWINSMSSSPSWDNGTLGNYWSDYTAKYPTAKEVNNTGTYDIPYRIVETTTYINDHNYYFYDNHPLVSPVDVSLNVTEVPSWVTPTPTVQPASQLVTNSYVIAVVIVVLLAAAFSSLLLYRRHRKTAS